MKKTLLKYLSAFIIGLFFLFLILTATDYFKSKQFILVDNFLDALLYTIVIIIFTALFNWARTKKQ